MTLLILCGGGERGLAQRILNKFRGRHIGPSLSASWILPETDSIDICRRERVLTWGCPHLVDFRIHYRHNITLQFPLRPKESFSGKNKLAGGLMCRLLSLFTVLWG